MATFSFLVLIVIAFSASNVFGCNEEIICFDNKVNEMINKQIGLELTEQYTFLYMSQLMNHHTNSYPKIAEYMRANAAEELRHAERFMQFQNQRGGTVKMTPVARFEQGSCANVKKLPEAFKCAIELEAHVTRQLTQLRQNVSNVKVDFSTECADVSDIQDDDLRLAQPMVVTCTVGEETDVVTAFWKQCECDTISSVAYVELEEMITHEFLEHQVEDMKVIANHYNNLKKLQSTHDAPGLGDYLFDKTF